MAPSGYDVVIIGAGIMGSCTAYYLSRIYGDRVLLLDQFDFLHRRGSSHGDSRIIRLTYTQDHYTYLMRTVYRLWDEAEHEAETKVFTKTGGLDFGKSENPEFQSLIEAARKWDIPHQVLTPQEVKAKFPRITLPSDYIAVYSPDSGVLKATKALSMFQNLAKKNGCKLEDNDKVTEIRFLSGGNELGPSFEILTQGHGVIKARKCVLASGAWTQKLLDQVTVNGQRLQLKLPLRPIQTTVAYWAVDNMENFSGLNKTFPVFISYEHGCIYGCPGLEFPGMIKVSAHHGPDCDPDRRTFKAGQEDIDAEIRPFLKGFFQGVSADEPVRTESCMYTMAPEENFIIDKVPNVSGLYVGCGFSGHGFKLAPIVGTILAGFVENDQSPYTSVQDNFSLARF